jgi:hypothetical protein
MQVLAAFLDDRPNTINTIYNSISLTPVFPFEPDSPDPQAVHSMFRASARFTARYGFSESVANGSLTQNSQIDARV